MRDDFMKNWDKLVAVLEPHVRSIFIMHNKHEQEEFDNEGNFLGESSHFHSSACIEFNSGEELYFDLKDDDTIEIILREALEAAVHNRIQEAVALRSVLQIAGLEKSSESEQLDISSIEEDLN